MTSYNVGGICEQDKLKRGGISATGGEGNNERETEGEREKSKETGKKSGEMVGGRWHDVDRPLLYGE
jgi:hypothetical protein